MHNHSIFRPLSRLASQSRVASFEVPAENHTSLSVVTLYALCATVAYYFYYWTTKGLRALLSALLRFFSHTIYGLFLEYQNAELYSRKKLLAAFFVPLLILVALLAGLRGVHALDATRANVQHDMMQGMQSMAESIAAARETDL